MSEARKTQEEQWLVLHHRINEALGRYGQGDSFREGDYVLLGENWGWQRHQIEVQNLALLKPHVVKELQSLLADYPDWDMTVRVDVPGKENDWPGMGIIIRRDEVIDELQREFLPVEFQTIAYEGGTSFLESIGRSTEAPIPEGAARQIARIKRDK